MSSQVLQTIAEFNNKLDDWLISAQSGVHAPEVLHFGTTRVRESDWVIFGVAKTHEPKDVLLAQQGAQVRVSDLGATFQ